MKTTAIRHLIITIALLTLSSNVARAYNLRQVSKQDGLTNSAILSIEQDKDGYMWLGSADGINIYDGYEVKTYKATRPENKLSGNLIEVLHLTKNGVMWVMTNYGLDRYNKATQKMEHFSDYSSHYQLRECELSEMFLIKEGSILAYYNRISKNISEVTLQGVPYNDILNYFINAQNILYIITKSDVLRFHVLKNDSGELTFSKLASEKIHDHNLINCFIDENRLYFIDTTHTLYEYNIENNQKYYVLNIENITKTKSNISSIVKYANDYFIGFQTDGLFIIRHMPDKAIGYKIEQTNINAGVFCLLHDKRQETLWIGTDGQGAYIYYNDTYSIRSNTLKSFTQKVDKPIRSLYQDHYDNLWIATKGDGIIRINDYSINSNISEHKIDYFNTVNSSLRNNSVFRLVEGTNQIMWIGSDQGLNYYIPTQETIKEFDVKIQGEQLTYVHDIYQPNDTTMWVATVGTGVVKISLDWNNSTPIFVSAERYTIRAGDMSLNYFFAIYPENDSIIWFGNRGQGAFRINTLGRPDFNISLNNDISNRHIQSVRLGGGGDTPMMDDIFCINKCKDGDMLFGTSAGLIKRSSNGTEMVLDNNRGLPNNTVHGILRDGSDNIWVSTNQGLARVMPDNQTLLTFDEANGLDVIEFSDGAYYRNPRTNLMFFGGINGFVAIKEHDYQGSMFIPNLIPDRLSIFGEEQNIDEYLSKDGKKTEKLKLSYSENFFSISFSAIDYINGNNLSFSYNLEGHSEAWVDNGNSNTLFFTNLSYGDYNLHVKVQNPEEQTESNVYTMQIKIAPPWYASKVAFLLYTMVLIAIVTLIILHFVEKNRKQREVMLTQLEQQHQQELYESKLSFFTNIAHEFCTPLTLIYGPCDRIMSYERSDRYIKRYASLIHRNANRLNYLIQDLIEFRKIETGNKQPNIVALNISELIGELVGGFEYLAESREITLEKEIQANITWNSDSNFITTIVSNLISNAFKYVYKEGTINVRLFEKDEYLKVEVENTGKGIKNENIERIFDTYTILDDFELGNKHSDIRNGLGLAISNNLAQLLGGSIEVESIRYQNTKFTITLPLATITESDKEIDTSSKHTFEQMMDNYKEETSLPETTFSKSKPTLLIIDDEMDMLWFLNDLFYENYNVIAINDPLQTDAVLSDTLPDVIICDVMMPRIDGISITKRIKENPKTAHIPLILISAKHDVSQKIEGISAGAENYITKPFSVDYISTIVDHSISRKETLKDYFSSSLSAYTMTEGKITHKADSKFVQDILDIINNNITDKELSASFIAENLNISTRQLYRRIKELELQSPLNIIRECRLHIAQDMLLKSNKTIDEIIYASGFASRSPFFRAFSEKFDCTPGEYREKKLHKQKEDM